MNRAQFEHDEKTKSAVIREFQVMGEAVRLLSSQAKTTHNHIPWAAIAGMRNTLVHEYFSIDAGLVWDTIKNDIPSLIRQLEAIVPPDSP